MTQPRKTWQDPGNTGFAQKADTSHPAVSDRLDVRSLNPMRRSGTPLDPSIDAEMIDALVETFYGSIRQDERLSMLFGVGMSKNWPEHLEQMKGFWRSLVMQTSEYSGRPVPAHMKMSQLQAEDFTKWLALFRTAAAQTCTASAAELMINRAETIARSLQMAVFLEGQIVPKDAFENGVMKPEVIEAFRAEDH